jgi:integrase
MGRRRKYDTHLPPCVYPKHGAFYYVKRNTWTWLGDTLTSALKAYALKFERPQNGLDALIDRTLENLRPRISANTARQYTIAANKLKKFLREFGHAGEVRPIDIVEIRTGMRDTPNMANRVLSFARQVFDFALEEKLIEANPAVGVKRLKEGKRGRLLNDDERARIYANSGPRLQCIEDLLEQAGQRVDATLKIKLTDLVEEGIRFPKFKTETKRIVKWTPELRAVVERAKGLRGNVRSLVYLLPGRGGKAPDYRSVKRQFDNACRAAGIEDAQLRDYRAVAATRADEQGKSAQKLLGHTSPAMTARYLRSKAEPVVEGPDFRHLIDKKEK